MHAKSPRSERIDRKADLNCKLNKWQSATLRKGFPVLILISLGYNVEAHAEIYATSLN